MRALGGVAAGWIPIPWPATGRAGASEDLREHSFSPGTCVGDVTHDEAIVWLRTEKEASVSVQYGKESTLKESAAAAPVRTSPESDFTAQVALRGLEPKTTYFYRPVAEGEKPGAAGRFVTAPLPDDLQDIQFAFSGDTRERYQPFSIMDSIRARQPEFFLHLGDTIYADREGRASRLPQFWAKYRGNRKDQPTQRLFAETSLYVVWDDHEVGDNYRAQDPLAPIGRKAFFDYWPVRRDSKDPDRVYRSCRWGKAAEVFVLDARQYRDPAAKTLLGGRQKEWLFAALASSAAQFKFIATSVPFSSPNPDKWGGFPAERDEVLKFIKEKRIAGIIFLTADVHYAAVTRVPGDLGLKEFIVGPLAAQLDKEATGIAKRFEFFYKDSYSYGLVRVHAKAERPYVEIEILDQNNRLLHKSRVDAPAA